jgi:hypothetical protein
VHQRCWRGAGNAIAGRCTAGRGRPLRNSSLTTHSASTCRSACRSRGEQAAGAKRELRAREAKAPRLGACPSIKRILLAKDQRVGFPLAA